MNKLIRFGISMEEQLLLQFDHLIAHKGYTNRSEAVRDIVRDKLVEENVETDHGIIFGAFSFYLRSPQAGVGKIPFQSPAQLFQEYYFYLSCPCKITDHCLEVVLLKGHTKVLKSIAEKILSFKGVNHGRLT